MSRSVLSADIRPLQPYGLGFGGLQGIMLGFPGDSDSKEFTYKVGDLGSIPGLGRCLEEGMATHSSILAWRIPLNRGAWWATVHGIAKSRT